MKKISSKKELVEKMLKGVNQFSAPIISTLGPAGKNVLLYSVNSNLPIITKDGATVAKFLALNDRTENVAAEIVKQASLSTNTSVGDGTTTAVVLAQSLYKHSVQHLPDINVTKFHNAIQKVSELIVKELENLAIPISSLEDIENIASISANDSTIGKLVSLAIDNAGADGAITISESRSLKTRLVVAEGFIIDSGYTSAAFITDEKRSVMRFENPFILVCNHKISSLETLMPLLELIARQKRPLILIADSIEGQALAGCIYNAAKGGIKIGIIKAPKYGEERLNVLQDLAVAVGAKFYDATLGMDLEKIELSELGFAKVVESTKFSTTIDSGGGTEEAKETRIDLIKEQLKQVINLHDGEQLQERLTRLASAVVRILVGGLTEVEVAEKRHRVEDSLQAVQAAQTLGIIPGGGTSLTFAYQNVDINELDTVEEELAYKIFKEVALSPLLTMAVNADYPLSPKDIENMLTPNGYDFANRCFVDNMFEKGIIDPCKVTCTALQNAVSAISTLLLVNYAIVEEKEN